MNQAGQGRCAEGLHGKEDGLHSSTLRREALLLSSLSLHLFVSLPLSLSISISISFARSYDPPLLIFSSTPVFILLSLSP